MRFCPSDEETSLGYVSWLFVRNLVALHNQLFNTLRNDPRLGLSGKSMRLGKMVGSNFFTELDFTIGSDSEAAFQL